MSQADLWYVLAKRSFFQNTNEKKKKKWHHLNTLKPGSESTKIKAVCQLSWSISAIIDFENTTLWHLLKPFVNVRICAKFYVVSISQSKVMVI